jgi:hypothetical protein
MTLTLWKDIHEGENVIVFKNLYTRRFSPENLGKDV